MKKRLFIRADLAKSHISSYTKKDGTFIAAHEDKRTAAPKAKTSFAVGSRVKDIRGDKYTVIRPDPNNNERLMLHEDGTPSGERFHVSLRISDLSSLSAKKKASAPKQVAEADKAAAPAKAKPKKAAKAKKGDDFGMWRGESGFMWPANGVEPRILFHNGKQVVESFVVRPEANAPVDFGGVFVGPNAGMGGDQKFAVVLDPTKGLSNYDFKYNLDYAKAVEALRKDFPDGLSDDDAEFIWDFVSEDRFSNDDDILEDGDQTDADRLYSIIARSNSYGKVSLSVEYATQRLRGLVARELGYQWVDMKDETGTSTLVLPGVELRAIKDEENFGQAEARIYDLWQADKEKPLTKSLRLYVRAKEFAL